MEQQFKVLDRDLPHSADSARAILGALILNNSLIGEAREGLQPSDFYLSSLRYVFEAILARDERGAEINPILIGEELRAADRLESVGGISFISKLTDGIPHTSNIKSYIEVVKEKASLRQIIKTANKAVSEAWAEDDLSSSISGRAEQEFAEISAHSEHHTPIITSFRELMNMNFDDGEMIAGHACRGEIMLVQSVTNHGKSTLIRNLSLALSTGGTFNPLAERGTPRRVLLLNLEGSAGRFQSDLRVMTCDFSADEFALLNQNFFPTSAPTVGLEPVSLSRHMKLFETQARRRKIDIIIIDTASAAFSLRNENDNSEIANSVMKPLVKLARKLNCLIILVHHIGKAKLEEGQSKEPAHRGRGASAWADFSTSIFNLEADPKDKSRIVLTCGKRKDGESYEIALRLSRDSRWFIAIDETPVKPKTNDDLVFEVMQNSGLKEMPKADIVSALEGKMSQRTVTDCLKRLEDSGKVVSLRRGFWSVVRLEQIEQPPIDDCLTCLSSEEDDNSHISYNF